MALGGGPKIYGQELIRSILNDDIKNGYGPVVPGHAFELILMKKLLSVISSKCVFSIIHTRYT